MLDKSGGQGSGTGTSTTAAAAAGRQLDRAMTQVELTRGIIIFRKLPARMGDKEYVRGRLMMIPKDIKPEDKISLQFQAMDPTTGYIMTYDDKVVVHRCGSFNGSGIIGIEIMPGPYQEDMASVPGFIDLMTEMAKPTGGATQSDKLLLSTLVLR